MARRPIRILASRAGSQAITSELTRRGFLAVAAGSGATAFLAACSGPSTSAAPEASGGALEDALAIYTWGEYDAPEVLTEFSDSEGPQITLDSYSSNEEMIARLVAANGTSGFDIIVPTGVFIPQLIEQGLVQELNLDLIPNLANLDPAFAAQDWDPENAYSICKCWGTTGFVYDSTVITRDLQTWEDFIDAAQNEASGRTSLLDAPEDLTGIYFWANGIEWTTTDDADLDAAEDFLVNTLAQHISAFDSYPGSGAMQQGTQVLMQCWNGDARLGILESEDPDRWQWRLGAPDTELWMDNWCIPVGAPHPEAAHAFIDYVLRPEVSLQELDYIGYNTGVAGIEEAAEAEGLERTDIVFFTPEQLETMHNGEVNEAQPRGVEIWNAMKAAAGQ
ncbi:spermidine/putrescine ABC transporter substrate-binding protein [Agrococcus versicolor]|uniref:Spermidine/putrescine ABC transporter substrate-binding protein n=1 Tax=Agrococcus versicolor TaxID=501482 RepID=A0ABP5MTF2_9MICO